MVWNFTLFRTSQNNCSCHTTIKCSKKKLILVELINKLVKLQLWLQLSRAIWSIVGCLNQNSFNRHFNIIFTPLIPQLGNSCVNTRSAATGFPSQRVWFLWESNTSLVFSSHMPRQHAWPLFDSIKWNSILIFCFPAWRCCLRCLSWKYPWFTASSVKWSSMKN